MPSHFLKQFGQNKIGRIAAGACVLAIALVAQYYLTKIPRHAVDIGKRSEFSPATVRLNQQELVIEGPVVSSPEGKLFARDPKSNEAVDVHFENARLDDQTIEDLSSPTFKSSTLEPIDYGAAESKGTASVGAPCRTSLEVEFKDGKLPSALYLYQMQSPAADRRHFEMKAKGAELVVQMTTTAPPQATAETEGCRKLLRVGNRTPLHTPPFTPIRIIAGADSAFRFTFRPFAADAQRLWDGSEGLLAPFELGPPMVNPSDLPPVLQARAVSVRNLQDDGSNLPPILSAQSLAGRPPLSVYDFKIGFDNLQVKVSGTGEMTANGQPETVNLLQRLEELGPLAKGILVALNAALLTWFIRLLSSKDARLH